MPTGAGDVPAVFGLDMRSANPAGGASLFDVSLEHDAFVTITVYDVTGRRVAELMNDMMPAGHHDVRWSGQSERGVTSSGVYFVRMDAAGRTFTHRVVVIR